MKLCALCGELSKDDAFTCHNCGHADWLPVVPAEVTDDDEEVVETPAKKRRSRRN